MSQKTKRTLKEVAGLSVMYVATSAAVFIPTLMWAA